MLLANSYWIVTSLAAHLLSGLVFFFLGAWLGGILWRGYQQRSQTLETENQRLAREAASLEQECRDLESAN